MTTTGNTSQVARLGADAADGSLSEGAAIAAAVDAVREVDVAARRAVVALQELDGRRAAAEEGMTLDAALRLHTGTAGSDVATLLTAADVLRRLPAAGALFERGVLSWGHVRGLVAGARRFDADTCAALDAHLADHVGLLVRLDPDRLSVALDDAIIQHQRLATVEARHDREAEANRFVLQGRLDGTATCWGQWDRESAALLADALDAEADAPQAAPCPTDGDVDDGDDGDGGDVAVSSVPSRSQQLADALLRLIGRGRTGADRPTPPARITVLVDTDQLTDRAAGELQTALRGRPPRIVRRALERLSCDAAIDAVVRDGLDLIAAQRYAPEVTAATRRAIVARDGGCRFPGCTAPVAWCDIHHITPRAQTATTGNPDHPDGDHHPSNLVLLCRRHHTLIHHRSWRQKLDPDGTYTLRRRGRTWTTLPRATARLPTPTSRAGPTRAGPDPRAGPPDPHGPDPLPF